ncbi:MAG: D-arabinono-1,4-lactone oxidase [Candidatus Dormibacteria bacterium]
MTDVWRNWSGDQRCSPARLRRPANVAEVRAAVGEATDAGEVVRVVGAGHSFNDIVSTPGTLLDIAAMDRLLDVDPGKGLVRVEAGITIRALGPQLARHGLAMANLGDIDSQSIAGAISTGTHGTGAHLGNISSQVVALQLVTAGGDTVEITDSDGETLRAARVSLGALGVITAVTLQCVPLFVVRRRAGSVPLEEILDDFPERAAQHDRLEFFVFPYADKALVKITDTVAQRASPLPSWKRYLEDVVLENRAFDLACQVGRRFPTAIPAINRVSTAVAGSGERLDYGYRVFATRRDVRFTEMEYAIPLQHAARAVRAAMALVQRERLPVNFPLEVRCATDDDAFLSPAYGRPTCHISVHTFSGMDFRRYFREVETIMEGMGGRPHWGKRHSQTADSLESRYPRWHAFQAVRRRLDPAGRFSNQHIERVLGPVDQRKAIPSPR